MQVLLKHLKLLELEKVQTVDEISQLGQNEKKLDIAALYDVIIRNNIKSDLQLCALAQSEIDDGKHDFAVFVSKQTEENRNELIKTAWKMQNGKARIQRMNKTRMDILEEHSHKECVCLGEWLRSAKKILKFNDILKREFARAIRTALEKGRGKKQNVMLTGPTNCGKSFLINPLKHIFHAFINPTNSTFSWVGAETAEIVYLNGFCWNEKIMACADMLNLLEGAPVHIAAPKTHFAEEIL